MSYTVVDDSRSPRLATTRLHDHCLVEAGTPARGEAIQHLTFFQAFVLQVESGELDGSQKESAQKKALWRWL